MEAFESRKKYVKNKRGEYKKFEGKCIAEEISNAAVECGCESDEAFLPMGWVPRIAKVQCEESEHSR